MQPQGLVAFDPCSAPHGSRWFGCTLFHGWPWKGKNSASANMRSVLKSRMSKLAALVVTPALCSLLSCNTPESIAKFCDSAVVTLKTGDILFDDMKASCIREAQTREDFGTFPVSDPDLPACNNIGTQVVGLKSASEIIGNYFTALNDLASFGTSKAGDGAKDLLTKASSQAKLSAAPQNALASIAGLLTRVATAGYQQKRLADDIVKVHGLGEAVGVAYLHQLQEEERKTATRYQEFLLQHPGAAEVILALDSRWRSDRANFAAKQKAALSYQSALDTMAQGNEDLAAHAHGLKAKDLPGLLSPYAAQLESLAPAIQKAFL